MTRIVAISGGVGGAKLASGLADVLPPEDLLIVANTGDDFRHLGLDICPDLDSNLYALAGLNNTETGWGRTGETFRFMEALSDFLPGEAWFSLGDTDLATHTFRTERLRAGASLTDVTRELCEALGVRARLVPMTDDRVATIVHTRDGRDLAFQHYFVRERCEPAVRDFTFEGAATARPQADLLAALEDPDLEGIVICPSNPYVSVAPLLALPGIDAALGNAAVPVVAVSPIVSGLAIKGPAAKMMAELDVPASAAAVAEHYAGRIQGFILDRQDADLGDTVRRLGIEPLVAQTIMRDADDRQQLATETIAFVRRLAGDRAVAPGTG